MFYLVNYGLICYFFFSGFDVVLVLILSLYCFPVFCWHFIDVNY